MKKKNIKIYGRYLTLIFILFFMLFVFVKTSYAQKFSITNPLGDETESDVIGVSMINTITTKLRTWTTALGTLGILLGGLMYMAGGVNQKLKELGTKTLLYTIIGFFIVSMGEILLGLVLSIVNPDAGYSIFISDTKSIIVDITNFIIGLIGIIGVIVLIISGIVWMTTMNSGRNQQAQQIFTYAIIGISIALLALSIFNFVAEMLGGPTI